MENKIKKYAVLKLYVNDRNEELVELYKKHVENHNFSIVNDPYPKSCFDLFIPRDKLFDIEMLSSMVNLEIKAQMMYRDKYNDLYEPCAFYIFPRSSISKTPLLLANHTGIIESGYRDWIKAAFRWFHIKGENIVPEYIVEKNERLLQICHPTLCPILVEMVSENQLSYL